MESLQGSVALVSGAATGIGKGIAVALAQCGVRVGINHPHQEEGARDTLTRVRAAGSDGMLLPADMRMRDDVLAMGEKLRGHFGSLEIWVNNAAYQPNHRLLEYPEEDFTRVLDTNLKGYLWGIQAAARIMQERGYGRIINISSVHGKRPSGFDPVYAMSKGGIKMLVREAAIEFGSYGITVNTIEPGAVHVGGKGNPRLVETPPPLSQPEDLARRRLTFPLGRPGLPADIGYLVVMLARPESAFVNGAAIRADGGSMLL